MFLRTVFILLMLCGAQSLFSQTYIGQRETVNFDKKQYNAGTQNWKIKQDAQGRVYFANNEGVLVFDGAYWQLYPLPNKTIVRSIEFGKDKKLYAGGQDEMGYFSPGKNGQLTFTSLKNLLPKADQNFSDIWDIVTYGDDVFFRSHDKIFRYSNDKITIYKSTSWLFMGLYQDQLIAHDEQKGILAFKNGNWQPFIEKKLLPNGFYITNMCRFGENSSLVTTAKNGVYILSGNQFKYFKLSGFDIDIQQAFSAAIAIGDNNYLISTYTNGIYQVDGDGTVIEKISKKEGLQNTNVRCMFMDANHDIWLGLDNGIDFIAFNNAVKHVNPLIFKDGSGFSMAKYHNDLYFSMSTGIYQLPIQDGGDLSYTKNDFKTLADGLSWHLSVVNDDLLAGRDDGVFRIYEGKLQPIYNATGFWLFESLLNKSGSNMIAAGNYFGVRLFERTATGFIDKGNIGKYYESARFLAIDGESNIWTSHPTRGVYKINTDNAQVKMYTAAQGLPSTLNNFVFKIKNRVVVATEKGVYEYNNETDRFQPDETFKNIFGTRSLRYLKEDPSGNIWFVQEKSIGVVDYSTSRPNIIYIPELTNKILSGFENVYPINDNNVFVGSENGYYHINYAKYKQNIHPLSVFIRKVKAIADTDSLLFGGYFGLVNEDNKQTATSTQSLSYLWNSLHFEYSSPIFEGQSNVTYSYYLEGFDKEWSTWSKKTEKDYTNLSAGTYTFKVKARNHQNNESAVSYYTFTINPPWYLSIWAFIVYVMAFAYLLYYVYRMQEKRHIRNQEKELLIQRQKNEEEQKQMAYLHQLELERSEKELVKLKNEKLESEIEFKNSELASSAMSLVQKKEFILKVKDELQRINKSGKDVVEAVEIKKILRLLSEEKKVNEEWEQFSIHFNKVHADFLTVIKERYPSINQQELKLSAYLIMNLSSKEIAQLMAISVRGVEISRYRLRKKLQIPTEINLFEFLFEIQREIMK
ncbi:ligand-binding sensor domain-containing protein [Mucilaginibacter flavus]|uniref:ligand-binding sensor domain-containing protein n=1 Tax=Mucilaginibacter flavus TaxID=931504 RepID=UPI0025B4BB2E|nr:triple tyrosine motif-containing protein [Mucilaginibacter flavus]MDN3584813.1 triple tyrosine motif-containing protein [Mucilaginibacter flavus]